MTDSIGPSPKSLRRSAACLVAAVLAVGLFGACSQILSADDLMGGIQDAGQPDADGSLEGGDEVDPDAEREAEATTDVADEAPDTDATDAAVDASDADASGDEPKPCTTETADCDGDASNGCETDITVSGSHCGACGHDCLGGACIDRVCQPFILATGQDTPTGLAVDSAGVSGRVYWTNRTDTGAVCSVQKSGGPVTVHATGLARPGAIVVDGSRLFWVNSGLQPSSGTVASVEVGADAGAVDTLASSQNNPFALAMTAGRLYWTASLDDTGSVGSVDTAGQDLLVIATNQDLPTGIAGDDVGTYWANLDSNEIRHWDRNTTPPVLRLFLDGLSSPAGVALDGLNVYWTEITGSVLGATKIGKIVTQYAEGEPIPTGIAVDGLHVYWVNNGNGTIRRAPKGASQADAGAPEPTTLAAGQNGPLVIVLDNTAVYWSNAGDGTIMRLAK